MVKDQDWLDVIYLKERRSRIKILDIHRENYTETLDLGDFVNLEGLYCYNNQLTELKLSNCLHLEEVYCQSNHLHKLTFPCRSEKLTVLNISGNRFSKQDLSMFSNLTNLKR